MSQYDPAPSNNHERNSHVSHGYVQIDLGPKHLLNECASTTDHSEHAFLHLVEADALPISVDEIEFGYRSGDNKVHPKIPSFYGTIGLNPHYTIASKLDNWQRDLIDTIEDALISEGCQTHHTRHEDTAVYVEVGNYHAARIVTGASTDECSVILDIMSIDHLGHVIESMAYDEPELYRPDRVAVLESTAQIFALCLSETIEYFKEEHDETYLNLQLKPTRVRQRRVGRGVVKASETPEAPTAVIMPGYDDIDPNQLTFDSLGGLHEPKSRLKAVANCIKDPEGTARYGIAPTHFVLYGPPGTGKTSLVKALAGEAGAKLEVIRSTDIIDMWVGQSGKHLREVFEKAINYADGSIILFFDEFDSIASDAHGTNEHSQVKRVFQEYVTKIEKDHSHITIAAATNSDMSRLDRALIRSGRLEPIPVPCPTEYELVEVWGTIITESSRSLPTTWDAPSDNPSVAVPFSIYAADVNPIKLAAISSGLTGADIEFALAAARRQAYGIFRETGVDTSVDYALLEPIVLRLQREKTA